MTLEMLQKEMFLAMKKGDVVRKSVLSNAIAAIKKAAIDKKMKDNITEELVNETLLKEQKTIQEMIDTCPKEREATLQDYQVKMAIISEYAPKLLSDPNELEYEIRKICVNHNIELVKSNKGIVMKTIAPVFKGKADMKIVNQVVANILK